MFKLKLTASYGVMAILWLLLGLQACSQEKKSPRGKAELTSTVKPRKKIMKEVAVIETDYGSIVVKFYEEDAPKHVANFKKLASQQFYDGTTFHRVIKNFMIQGGDPNSKDSDPYNDGQGGPGYTIPAEIKRFHKRGALAAARLGDAINPQKASSGSQFYIVQNGPIDAQRLKQLEMNIQAGGKLNFAFTQEQIDLYSTVGGTPHLDGEYTVYGEVVSGMDVVDRIADVPVGPNARPTVNVTMKRIRLQTMEIEE